MANRFRNIVSRLADRRYPFGKPPYLTSRGGNRNSIIATLGALLWGNVRATWNGTDVTWG